MAGYRIPRPICSTRSKPIDNGTLCLSRSLVPGSVGIGHPTYQKANCTSNRAYLFIIADEAPPSGKTIRKLMAASESITSRAYGNNPEVFGLKARSPTANASIGEHASGNNHSPYLSSSTNSGGAPNFNGTPYSINIENAKAAAARIYSTEQIILDLQRLAREQPHLRFREDKLIGVITDTEREVLVERAIPASTIKSPLSMNLIRGLRAVQFIGIVASIYQLTQASRASIQTHSIGSIATEGIRQLDGRAGAAGGIETGPGAVLTGAAAALIFSVAAYFSADWLAEWSKK